MLEERRGKGKKEGRKRKKRREEEWMKEGREDKCMEERREEGVKEIKDRIDWVILTREENIKIKKTHLNLDV